MNLRKKNTSSKIIILIFILSSISIILFAALLFYVKKQQQIDYKESRNQFKNDVFSIYKMELLKNESYVNDIVYWDEFLNYINNPSDKWFNDSVATSLYTLNFDQIYVLDKKGNLIVKRNKNVIILTDLQLVNAIKNIKLHSIFRYYKKTEIGYVEIIGSGIYHSTNANKKFGNPNGYFFVVRVLNNDYFKNLSETTNSKCQISANKHFNNNSEITTIIEVKDEIGKKIGHILFNRNYNNNFSILKNIIYFITFISLLNLFIYFLFIRKWVNNPLNLVRKILENNNSSAINNLVNIKGEFGYIGKLFRKNKEQEELLIHAKLKAEQKEKLKSVFLANLSHEIKTPMNAILGFTHLLKNDKLNKEETKIYLETIEKSGNNLVLIINDLIEMSKIDSKQIIPNYTFVNLKKCLTEVYETIKVTIPLEKNITFIFEKNNYDQSIIVKIDETKVKQIFVNLITNALKYTDNGEITFGYDLNFETHKIDFFVKDTGYGISPEDQKSIFERFKRIDNEYTTKSSGLGLGLSITKAYIDIMHGNINLTSSIGKGTKFYFSIPLETSQNHPEKIVKEVRTNISTEITTNKRILVAEDDEINYLLFTKIMAPYKNIELIRAKNGHEAVSLFTNDTNIDLVFLDIKMPVMNGFEAYEQISKTKTTIPIIAQTAFSAGEEIDIIINTGFTDYILKPIIREKLIELINKYLIN